MREGFYIVREFEDGQILHIAWRRNQYEAEQLVAGLQEFWPAVYRIEETQERSVTFVNRDEEPSPERTRRRSSMRIGSGTAVRS